MVRPPERYGQALHRELSRAEGHLPRFRLKISHADVPDFMITVIDDRSSIQKAIGIWY